MCKSISLLAICIKKYIIKVKSKNDIMKFIEVLLKRIDNLFHDRISMIMNNGLIFVTIL